MPHLLAILLACGGSSPAVTPKDTAGADSGCPEVAWYHDADGDAYGASDAVWSCEAPGEQWVEQDGDCSPADYTVFPGATERCNDQDDDCDGVIDDGVGERYYTDADGDSYGDPKSAFLACERPDGTSEDGLDCDDGDALIHPDGVEWCNGLDDDCDGVPDDDPMNPVPWWLDADGDLYGDPEVMVEACAAPDGYVGNADDCDDADPKRWEDCAGPPASSGTCGGGYPLSRTYGKVTEPELHIVGVYEPDDAAGVIDVEVDRPGSTVILVLSSYEPVAWRLGVEATTTLQEVVLNGYNAHTLTGAPKGTTVTRHDGIGLYWAACGYELPSSGGGCDTETLVALAQAAAGVTLNSFTGCYRGQKFSLLPGF